ncbi:MAG: replication/maintenance protein RepL [Hyphomicrobiaceae bacterium]
MKPARRTKGPRPRARSTSRQQAAIWAHVTATQEWTTRAVHEATGVPLSTVQQYVVALERGAFVKRIRRGAATQTGAEPDIWRTHWTARKLAEPPLVTYASRTARHQGVPTP